MMSEGAELGAGIDLTQFYEVFFEEAGENLDRMERQLLEIDIQADDEALNAIFRCAHSVKGGAATFGFSDMAELTHQMETLLDKLRRRELEPATAMVDVLLQAGDALRAQLARHQGLGGPAVDTAWLLSAMRAMAAGVAPGVPAPVNAAESASAFTGGETTPKTPAPARVLELRVGPLERPEQADDLVTLFQEIADLGQIEAVTGRPGDGMRHFKVVTTSSDSDLLDLFSFHVPREAVLLRPFGAGGGPDAGSRGVFLVEASAAAATAAAPAAAPESPTLRVPIAKVDQLINLVGELIVTQAMLARHCAKFDPALYRQMATDLADLDRHTRELQACVMSVRMIPMGTVFCRFPRMLRELANRLGKKVHFVTRGDATELDKGLVEQIADPLTHLVRNSCDHGIESPAERRALGKPEQGTIGLSASHQGGSIVIEVRDDGRGLSRDKLIAKARERGIDAPDAMSDAEAWALIFAPGFSTAEVVTDLSGRGVGMDVVKKNIAALGGTVEIDSTEGSGMSVKVRLPLTLAIMDGLSVAVGDEVYILPLLSVVESFQVRPGSIKTIGAIGRVVELRGDHMPVLELAQVLAVPRSAFGNAGSIMVVAEAEGGRVALLVDGLLGQRQVVVKNVETHYRKVSDVSGATVMGDGRVALILDVGSLVRRSRH